MARTKERGKIIHEPSTHEIFSCLSTMPKWATVLLQNSAEKQYTVFLRWLLERKFYEENNEKITVKKIATDFKGETSKVTKWLHEIYNDIIELNFEKPELFTDGKPSIMCYFRYYDSHATIHLGLNFLPREYEHFSFFFIKAKVGTDRFWVSRIEHEIFDTGVQVTIWFEGGILNRYREMAVEEGLVKGWVGFMDKWNKASFEIDEVLLTHLRR